jgi:hypothetical protein
MSTRTMEISAAVKTAAGGASEARTHAEQSLESTRAKAETAHAHGWGGVGANMEQAAEHLEGVIEQLGGAEEACEAAAEVLDQITDQMSSSEVAERLLTATGELDTVATAAEAAVTLVDKAIGACEAAGQQSLPVSLNILREEVDAVRERVQETLDDVDAEHQATGMWSDDDEDGPAGI